MKQVTIAMRRALCADPLNSGQRSSSMSLAISITVETVWLWGPSFTDMGENLRRLGRVMA
ncbi:hypothetical protein [Rhizobium sp. BK376]|uniref:hypothetical protein n=1 Tax=Rhizobium sp. BK376 TaxID=2512149 RepID=UPI001FDFBAF0|nr:hypothetical protein [Rhizobium sp. BK376]